MTRFLLSTALCLVAVPGAAQDLRFPAEADQSARRSMAQDSQFLATAGYDGNRLPGITAEGSVEQVAWTVGSGKLTTMELLATLRDQLVAAGFEPLYECETASCGGFDFRYGIDILPEPDMHVNLGDFRYFAARRSAESGTPEYVALLVSRSASTGFVQLTRVGDAPVRASFTASTKTPAPDAPVVAPGAGPIVTLLEEKGHATLNDLVFRSGSSDLGPEEFRSLRDLATYLSANPDRRVMLVGHTDAEGALSANVTLSRRRATAVMTRLIEVYGIPREQIAAEGVGFLAPRASNLTPDGRTQNRRVEVILTSTQ